MSERKTESSISYCEENKRLLQAFTDAVSEVSLLQDQQVAAMLSGDPEFNRFDILIQMAADKKQHAKYAYMHHIDSHGC